MHAFGWFVLNGLNAGTTKKINDAEPTSSRTCITRRDSCGDFGTRPCAQMGQTAANDFIWNTTSKLHPGFFPKQFTVRVLNATLYVAALVLVGVVGFLGSEVVLSPVVSGCLPSCGGWVLVGVAAFLGSEVILSPVVSGCLPSCGGWVLVGVAASRTKTFRNQNHRFHFKFAYSKLFGVYAGVIFAQTRQI